MKIDDAITTIVTAVTADRGRVLDDLVTALEQGTAIGHCLRDVSFVERERVGKRIPDMGARIRAIRDDLIELDLYRFHFGELPDTFDGARWEKPT